MPESPFDILLALIFGSIGSGIGSVIALYPATLFFAVTFTEERALSRRDKLLGLIAFLISFCLPIGGATIVIRLYTGSIDVGLSVIATVIGIAGVLLFAPKSSGGFGWTIIIAPFAFMFFFLTLPIQLLFGKQISILGKYIRIQTTLALEPLFGKARWIVLLTNRWRKYRGKTKWKRRRRPPSQSHTGTFAYWFKTGDFYGICLIRLVDDKQQILIYKQEDLFTFSNLRWSPLANQLMYTKEVSYRGQAYGSAAYILNLHSFKIYRIPGSGHGLGWSTDGKQILIEETEHDTFQLTWMNAHTFETIQSIQCKLPKELMESTVNRTSPLNLKLSPDNRWLAFTRNMCLFCVDMESLHKDGLENLRMLVKVSEQSDHDGIDFAWSPDSQRIVFSQHGNIYVTDMNGNSIQLTQSDDHKCENPTWSPDGQYIAYFKNKSIWTMRSDGSENNPLLETTYAESKFSLQWGAADID